MSQALPEGEILKPRDPSLDNDSDNWPQFVVTSARVHLPGFPDSTTSLLEAGAAYPLTVVGQLEPLDADDVHLYTHPPSKKRVNLVVEDVRTYAYGQYADHSFGFWAAGKAGWFEIKPGRGYKDIYREMGQAVNVLYFISDSLRQTRKVGKGKGATPRSDLTVQGLFDKYAAEELETSDSALAAEAIYAHKEFLVMSMISGRENLDWSKYSISGHFYAEFPDLVTKIRQRIKLPMLGQADSARSRQKKQGSVETSSITSSSRRRPGRPAKNTSTSAGVMSLDDDSDTISVAQEIPIHATTKASSKLRNTTATVRMKSQIVRQRSPKDHVRRKHYEESASTPAKTDDSDEELEHQARKATSGLRPRAGQANKSSGRRSGKAPAAWHDEEEDDEDEIALSPTGGKRKHPQVGDSRRPFKRRDSRPDVDEGIDIPTSPSEFEDPNGTTTEPNFAELPLRELAHIPDPLQEDTWVCALDGCMHKVYGASKLDSQKLIRAHYALHAYDDDERVKMVKRLQAPSLPAGRLMERVKLQAKVEGFPGSRQMGSRYPVPVAGVVQNY